MRKVKVAFASPGQGIEDWSAGRRLLEESDGTQSIYDQVYDATGVDILEVCDSTEPVVDPSVVQPAALGIGYAQAEVLKEQGIKPDYLIGISAGEFTVAAISRSLSLKDAAYISQQRGISQTEVGGGLGGAVTALHKRPLDLKSLMHDLEGVWPSNFHAPGVTTISYLMESRTKLLEWLGEQGARVKDLNMPFAPHGNNLLDTQERVDELMPKGLVKRADTKIISIRSAKVMRRARSVRHSLVWQTTQPTRFNQAVETAIKRGVIDFHDIGPGDACTKLLGRIITNPNIRINPVGV